MSFICGAFDAQGSSFAAIYPSLDHHRLRVVSVNSKQQAQNREFVIDRGVKIKTISWVYLPLSNKQPVKKRKHEGELNSSNDVIVLGTTQGTLLVYSPSSNAILTTLKTGSSSQVCSILAYRNSSRLKTLQNDGTLTEFDLGKMILVASTVVPVENCSSAAISGSNLLIANTQPSIYGDGELKITYPGFSTPITQLLPLGNSHFAALTSEDRQVAVYEIVSAKVLNYLQLPSTNAVHMSVNSDLSALSVVSEDGDVYVFESPLKPIATTDVKKKGKPSRVAPSLTIEVTLEKKHTKLVVLKSNFTDVTFLQLMWAEQGSIPVFDEIKITHGNNSTLKSGTIKLEKQPAGPQAMEFLIGNADPASVEQYEDHKSYTTSGSNHADLSDDETLADRLDALEVELNKNSKYSQKNDQVQAQANAKSEGESRLRRKDLKLKLSQPGSFATLLNQALTLNDKQLLEICLEENDVTMIKASIVKLEPVLAATLLEHLATTLSHSQNRSNLNLWIRNVIVIHGGYLVTLPNLLKTLAALHSTLSGRASTLPRLLALQGRLELLEEQLFVRSELAAAEEDDDDVPDAYYNEDDADEGAVIVNGEEALDEEDEQYNSNDEIMLSE